MIEKAISVIVGLAIAALALWIGWGKVVEIAQAPLIAKHKEAIEAQAAANTKAIDALAKAKGKIQVVYVDKITEITAYEKTLSPDSACRATAEFISMYNSASR